MISEIPPRRATRRGPLFSFARREHHNTQILFVSCWRYASSELPTRGATPPTYFHRKSHPKISFSSPKHSRIIPTLCDLFQDVMFQHFSSFPLNFQPINVSRPGKPNFYQ
ncbi:hypothetical protein Hanom_Chr01g00043931 [Helianthus anomalus]